MSHIHTKIVGEGYPVVLIHGFCETADIWDPLINKLALTNQVIALDLPGFGQSTLPEHPFSIMDIAEAVHNFLSENNLLNSVLIGHSLGGYVVLAMMEQHHDDYRGFGLFHSTALADDEEKKQSRNKTIAFVKQKGVNFFADAFVKQLFYSKNRPALKSAIDKVTADAANTDLAVLIQYMEAMRDRPDRSALLGLDMPVLFIAGAHDTSVPIEKSRAQFPLIRHPSIEILAEAAHMGMYEATEKTYLAIRRFLSIFDMEHPSETTGTLPNRDLKKNLGCG